MPVLLKQYLKLGGHVLGFNIDRNFGDCVYALLMVDLPASSPRVLARYMGNAGAESYLASHSFAAGREAG
jgi:hypothetical protein